MSHQRGGYAPVGMNDEVYKFAVREVPAILKQLLADTKTEAASIDWLLLHQANQRILDAAAERQGIAADKVLTTWPTTATLQPPRSR